MDLQSGESRHVTEPDDVQVSQLSHRKQAAPQEILASRLGSQNARNHQSQRFRPTLTHGRAESAWSSASDQFTEHHTLTCRFIQLHLFKQKFMVTSN